MFGYSHGVFLTIQTQMWKMVHVESFEILVECSRGVCQSKEWIHMESIKIVLLLMWSFEQCGSISLYKSGCFNFGFTV